MFRCWLFQLLKEHIHYNVHIGFFTHQLQPFLLRQLSNDDHGVAAKNLIVFHGWDMLSSFCLHGDDIDEVSRCVELLCIIIICVCVCDRSSQ